MMSPSAYHQAPRAKLIRRTAVGGVVASWSIVIWAATPAQEVTQEPGSIAAEYLRRAVAPPTYRLELLAEQREPLERRYSPVQLGILEKLNRADLAHLPLLGSVIVPERWTEGELGHSPFPSHYAWAAPHRKAVVVHQPWQAFAAYAAGELVRWGPVSTGRESLQTPAGVFHLNWKSRGRYSSDNPEWFLPWYFNFESQRGLSFHAFDLPGFPASHACIRMLDRDARWLYEWGEEWKVGPRGWPVQRPGTPVLIIDAYDFSRPPPWRSLDWRSRGPTLP